MLSSRPAVPPPVLPTADEFKDKVAVVTGGSDGIGRGIVEALVSVGCHAFFCGRGEETGLATQKEVGPLSHFIRCDVSSPDQIKTFIKQAGDFRGSIDFLVNNAGMDPGGYFEGTKLEFLEQMWQTNLRSMFLVTQTAMPYLKKGTGKAIVNIGTTNYMRGIEGMTAYNTSKSGIVGFTRTLAREMGHLGYGIRVNLVSPGWTVTDRQIKHRGMDENTTKGLIQGQSVRELMYPEHIASLTMCLLSRASTAVSGQNIVADGGAIFQ